MSAGYVPFNERPYGGHERLLALAGSPQRVLDVGTSSGYLARRFAAAGASVVGIDVDEEAAAEAHDVCEQVLVGDVETMELPFAEQSFDVVLCGDVIEHLRDPERFLVRVRALIRPGGRLVLTTPNIANWSMRLALLAGRWRHTERGILDLSRTHLFTKKTLEQTLERGRLPNPRARRHRAGAADRGAVGRAAGACGRTPATVLLAYQFVVSATPR